MTHVVEEEFIYLRHSSPSRSINKNRFLLSSSTRSRLEGFFATLRSVVARHCYNDLQVPISYGEV